MSYRDIKGFLFIEPISIASFVGMLGIFSAALFPSMAGYLERSRDVARMSNLKDISTALGAYYADTLKYPISGNGCIDSKKLNTLYMAGGVPTDPLPNHIHEGCTIPGEYVYRTGTGSSGWISFALGATLENEIGGNSKVPLNQYSDFGDIEESLSRGSGKYYILVR